MTDPSAPPVVLAELRPSRSRRGVGVAVLCLLGIGLLAQATAQATADLAWTFGLLASGGLCLWLAIRMWQATAGKITLTAVALTDHNGTVLARVEDIAEISRGAFALKPAGGFTLSLRSPAPRAWAPGLWWRLGRKLGIGGVVHRYQAGYMAEVLEGLIAARR